MKRLILFTTTVLLSSAVLAGGGLFGGGGHSKNPNGVKSIAVELCGVEKCPKFRMIEGECTDENGYEQFGTCFCKAGFVPVEGKCEPCPEGEYSDGKSGCTKCGPGTYAVPGTTECKTCEGTTYSPGGTEKCYECPAHAECTNESFSCKTGFHTTGGSWDTLECVCNDGTTLSAGDTCVTCASLHKGNGAGGECGACSDNYYTLEGKCQLCSSPTESCAIESDIIDPDTNCITTKKITCEGGNFCNDSGMCEQICSVGIPGGKGEATVMGNDGMTQCYCANLGEVYNDGICGKNQGNSCKSYRSCPKDEGGNPQFCDVVAVWEDVIGDLDCVFSQSDGVCRPAIVKELPGGYKTLDWDKVNWEVDWWTAMDFCNAIEASPVGVFDYCSDEEKQYIITHDQMDFNCTGWSKNLRNSKVNSGTVHFWTRNLLSDFSSDLTGTCFGYRVSSIGPSLEFPDNGYAPLCRPIISCPENSSIRETTEQIGTSGCYCETCYVVNATEDGCIWDDSWTITELIGCKAAKETTCIKPDGTTYYKCSECSDGYMLSGDKCTCDDSWTITESIIGCKAGKEIICTKPDGTTYYKCSECRVGYLLDGDTCVFDKCYGVSCSIIGQTCNPNNGFCECSAGQVSNGTECVDVVATCPINTMPTGVGGPTGIYVIDDSGLPKECKCKDLNKVYTPTGCQSQSSSCFSYDTNECGYGYYCQFAPGDCYDDYSKIDIPVTGVCKSITPCGMYNIKTTDGKFKASDASSSCRPDWWTAHSICASYGMRMVTLSDLGLDCTGYYCPKDTVHSRLITAGINSGWYWTQDLYDTSGLNSCGAWSSYNDIEHSMFINNRADAYGALCVEQDF